MVTPVFEFALPVVAVAAIVTPANRRVADGSRFGGMTGLFGGMGGGTPRPILPAFPCGVVNDLLILFATVATLVSGTGDADELLAAACCVCC